MSETQASYSTSTNGRRLSVHQAQVTTAAVTIKTLSLTGKQVTLAVFRQLIEEPLIDATTGQFRGLPWGTVNYHPDKTCADVGPHLHAVWQHGGELRRSCVSPRGLLAANGTPRHRDVAGVLERYVVACLVAGQRPNQWVEITTKYDGDYVAKKATSLRIKAIAGDPPRWANGLFRLNPRDHAVSELDASNVAHRLTRAVAALANGKTPADALAYDGQHRASGVLDDARTYLAATGGDESPEAIAAPIYHHLAQTAGFAEAIDDRYRELENLDQLFIAV